MTQFTFFIADLHLNSTTPNITESFFEFLESIPPEADALYILGDLFQVWIGDDDSADYNQQIKANLKAASKRFPIYLMPGNRDFLLGEKFAKESGCTLIPDPYVIKLYDKNTVLTHGDILCKKIIKYRVFRKIIRFSFGIKIFLKMPLEIRRYIAQQMQKYSARMKSKRSKASIVTRQEIKAFLAQYNAQKIIHGHMHLEEIDTFWFNDKQIRRISLAQWQDKKDSLVYSAR